MKIMYFVHGSEYNKGIHPWYYIGGDISISILTTYDVIYDKITQDILRKKSNNEYNNFEDITCTFNYIHIFFDFYSNRIQLDLKKLKFDIDVTQPFKPSKLIENVI